MGKNLKSIFLFFLFIFVFSIYGENVKEISKDDNSITIHYEFKNVKFKKNGQYDYISIDGTKLLTEPGKPIIPVKWSKILIPEGKEVEKIETIYNYRKIPGHYTLPTAQIPQKIGQNQNFKFLKFTGIFPEKNYVYRGSQFFRGYKISLIQIFPVKYNSETNEIEISKDVYVKVILKSQQEKLGKAKKLKIRGKKQDMKIVSELVDNPEEIITYKSTGISPLQEYEYVVITSLALSNSFNNFITDKINRGISATIVTTDYIYSNFTGIDNQEQIRNFIIWAYNNWNTEYVLLGGDVDVIPIRYFYNPVESDPIPTDVYYSNLDGTFDYDNDGVYGEYNDGPNGGDIDLLPDIYVGRIPANTSSEVSNFLNKVFSYVRNNTKDLKKAGMIGKKLDDIPTWGGDGKDEVAKIFPDDWEITKFYERDNTFSVGAVSLYINMGTHFINIFTHGSEYNCADFTPNDVNNLSNFTYPIFYSQGCYNAALDTSTGDAVGEVFITSAHGAVAFVGNTRFGWYMPGNPQAGPSQIFDEEFFSVLFRENFVKLGDAFYRSKANLSGFLNSYTRYVYIELILFGDPEIDAISPAAVPPPQEQGYIYYLKDNNIYLYNFQDNTTTQLTYFTSGNILNPVISEDGEKILFSYSDGGQYNLYWINSDGSGLENLSEKYNLNQATKNQKYACLNSDKTLLVFTAESKDPGMPGGQQVWLKELTGQKKLYQLTFNNPETLSPWNCSYPVFLDDNYILFKADDSNSSLQDYWIVSTKGTDYTNITQNSSVSPYFPRLGRPMLSLDKSMIIYGKQTQNQGIFSDWEIYVRSARGGQETKVLSDLYYGEIPENQPDPMPVFINPGQFIFRGEEYSTGNLYLLFTIFNSSNPYQIKIPDTDNCSFPCYFVPRPEPYQFVYVGDDNQIWLRTYDGQDIQLTSTINTNDFPSFDIQGNYITYSGNGIWIMKTNGANKIQIDNTYDAKYPVISPDGNWVFYVKNNDIYARRIDKSVLPQRITDTPQYAKQDLDISPDGKTLIYSGQTDSGNQIFSLPITIFDTYIRVDGQATNLTNDPGHENYNPSFSPDGSKIVFISTKNGSPSIFMMNSDGTNQQYLRLIPLPRNPSYPVFNPYGENEIAYISEGTIYIGDIETQQAEKLIPEIYTFKKFDWASYSLQALTVTRQFIYSKADPRIPFKYNLVINVTSPNPPSYIILEEKIPDNWTLINSTFNGEDLPTSNQATTGTLKWILGTSFPLEVTGGILEITLNPNGDGPEGEIRSFNGGFYQAEDYYTSKGDSYIVIGYPPIPPDTDEDWKISDEELLDAIDYWATNTQIHGWPENLEDWDAYLLDLIDFWADSEGYEYDITESLNQEKPCWKTK